MSPTTGRWVSVARASGIAVGESRLLRIDDVPVAVFHLADGCHVIDNRLRLKKYNVIERGGDIFVAT